MGGFIRRPGASVGVSPLTTPYGIAHRGRHSRDCKTDGKAFTKEADFVPSPMFNHVDRVAWTPLSSRMF